MVERVTGELVRQRLSPLYDERSRWIGQVLPASASTVDRCVADVFTPTRLAAGFRLAGTVQSVGLPFGERPVFVTDAGGKIVGIGNVDRGWYGPGAASQRRECVPGARSCRSTRRDSGPCASS